MGERERELHRMREREVGGWRLELIVAVSTPLLGSLNPTVAMASPRDEFEWLVDYASFRDLLRSWVVAKGWTLGDGQALPSALVLGCGSSGLSQALVQDGVCGNVLSVDISESCVAFLAEKNKGDARLRWEVADINNVDDMASVIGEEKFDLVVDKATLDAIVCETDCSGYLHCVCSYLRCGGGFVFISLHHGDLLYPLLDFKRTPGLEEDGIGRTFDFECKPIIYDDADKVAGDPIERSFVTLSDLQRRCGLSDTCKCSYSPNLERIQAHFKHTLDWYMTVASPLLSKEREVELRKAFANACSSSQDALALENAFRLMFTDDERHEYTFQDFIDDFSASRLKDQSVGLGTRITVDEALKFIQTNQ